MPSNGNDCINLVFTTGSNFDRSFANSSILSLSLLSATASFNTSGLPQELYAVEGLKVLRQLGSGTLSFTGNTFENGVSADARLTLVVSPDLLILRGESRPLGSATVFHLRGLYTLRQVATTLR